MDAEAISAATSRKERQIQRLLWASLALTIITFGLSMAFLGIMSFFISWAGVGLSLIFIITLLFVSAKERRQRNGHHGAANTVVARLSCTQRKPSIFFAFFIAMVWAAALGMLCYTVAFFDHFEWVGGWAKMRAVPAIELTFCAAHVAVLVTYGVLCVKERRRVLGAEHEKWYMLGQYR
ncbi:hypothetical protein D9611_008061 [Ephemerocybe angulata]|uniref:Uncharacterized protein n=1 Tax=Ephemerocybe angulata TaxID=980116 RepID=A0A8H5BZ92_9AGAR|nr:hypothetical protein D9611_008061 [Tulosesus angulatus]